MPRTISTRCHGMQASSLKEGFIYKHIRNRKELFAWVFRSWYWPRHSVTWCEPDNRTVSIIDWFTVNTLGTNAVDLSYCKWAQLRDKRGCLIYWSLVWKLSLLLHEKTLLWSTDCLQLVETVISNPFCESSNSAKTKCLYNFEPII